VAKELAERFVVHVDLPSCRCESSIAGRNRDMKATFSLGVPYRGYRRIPVIDNTHK
jgi:hypothetical protein